jgi:hypothetical protein
LGKTTFARAKFSSVGEGYRPVQLEGLEQSKRDGKHDRAKYDAEQSKHTDSAKDGKENEKFV